MDYETWDRRRAVQELFFMSANGMTPIRRFEGLRLWLQPLSEGLLTTTNSDTVYSVPGAVLMALGWSDEAIGRLSIDEVRREIMTALDLSYIWASLFEVVSHNPGDYTKFEPEAIIYNPQRFLGAHASYVLEFWRLLDTLTPTQWLSAYERARRDQSHVAFLRHEITAYWYEHSLQRSVEEIIDRRLHELAETATSDLSLAAFRTALAADHTKQLNRDVSRLASFAGWAIYELVHGRGGLTKNHLAVRGFGLASKIHAPGWWDRSEPYVDDAEWCGFDWEKAKAM